ncbi:MAG: hypothetical protein N0A24_02060 [Armatimonadetes bacterium]|nr:hypothetical protein [Armatimonadota bacterium]MDW8152999.1 hypothetical protein [Armatimonadota bacterium]
MISDDVRQGEEQLGNLLVEGLEAPPLYRDLATAYTDLEGLLRFLRHRSFSGVVAVRWPQGAYYLLVFRGTVRYARTPLGAHTDPEQATALLAREAEHPDGVISVHPLPEELFPEAWIESQPVPSEPVPEASPQLERRAPEVEASEAEPPLPEPTPGPDAEDVRVWTKMLEGLYQRYQRLVGPGPARQLEREIQAVLAGCGGVFVEGRLQGPVEVQVLKAAVARCAEIVRKVAGQAFLVRTAQGLLRELGVAEVDLLGQLMGS